MSAEEILDEDPTICRATAERWLRDHGQCFGDLVEEFPDWVGSGREVLEFLGY